MKKGLLGCAAFGILAGIALAGGGNGKSMSFAGSDKNATLPGQDRMLFVWDSSIPGDAQATEDLLDFAKKGKYTSLAIEASPVGYGASGALERYSEFVSAAKHKKLQVRALIGYGWFTVSPNAGLPDQPTSHHEGFFLVQGIVDSGLFHGLVDDSLPYAVTYAEGSQTKNNLWDNTQAAAEDYVTWLAGTKKILGEMPYYKCSPFWFDDEAKLSSLKLGLSPVGRSLASYEAEYADVRVLLAYRDRAWGPNGILHVTYADLKLGRTMIAVETADLGSADGFLTFAEEGQKRMEDELTLVRKALQVWPLFQGVAVHHYAAAKALKP